MNNIIIKMIQTLTTLTTFNKGILVFYFIYLYFCGYKFVYYF